MMFECQQVTKRYLGQTALNKVTLQLPQGKMIGVIGPNGSGKTTLLKLLAGLCQPSEGKVLVGGRVLKRRDAAKIAYLSELDAFYSFFTVEETLHFFASQFGDLNVAKAEQMLQFLNLDAQVKVSHLSKGHRGRLKLVLALARDVPLKEGKVLGCYDADEIRSHYGQSLTEWMKRVYEGRQDVLTD
ncbi:ABC-type multidrug transport system ATPase subunit [Caldalkalibacillus uzonensis]|uniref:ABC-type multidrug transport system ATPase subunit n=1 Tax=Caldalkalibacillus uzonensis TaxID=353224 RepID=A0ABU0CX25_9BACI|nr:ABC transporter ATP-binding protein [Caldalkalibacillus uzonensis]MDQ0340722.1 ABC-type multidrug transport system ATPase subunit [Caldalkalibacillus uzonensis]